MTERTDALIAELARGLPRVRRLPSLARVAAIVVGAGLGLTALNAVIGAFAKEHFPKPDFGPVDEWTLAAHALLAGGALAFALGACVPGRERLARGGAWAIALAALALAGIAAVRIAAWPGPASVETTWLARTIGCSLSCVVPGIVPAVLLVRFAARAVPRRAGLVLAIASVASLALLSAPGVVACAYPDELHHVLSHALVPLLGGIVVWLALLPLYFSLRRTSAA
jgi:hypothetical protein